jgi:hypothetical protein
VEVVRHLEGVVPEDLSRDVLADPDRTSTRSANMTANGIRKNPVLRAAKPMSFE